MGSLILSNYQYLLLNLIERMKVFAVLMVLVAAVACIQVEERGILEELHIDGHFVDMVIDAIKSIDFAEVLKAVQMLICGEDTSVNGSAGGLKFSFEFHKQLIR